MLGYNATVYEIRDGVSTADLKRIVELPYEARASHLGELTDTCVARIPYRTWVDGLLLAAEAGRVRMLHGGGYPYLFHAPGAEIKSNFAASGIASVASLSDATWYLVEAWDQS